MVVIFDQLDLEVHIEKQRRWWSWQVVWAPPVYGFKTPVAALRAFANALEQDKLPPRRRPRFLDRQPS